MGKNKINCLSNSFGYGHKITSGERTIILTAQRAAVYILKTKSMTLNLLISDGEKSHDDSRY
jgi:hypothetical protein